MNNEVKERIRNIAEKISDAEWQREIDQAIVDFEEQIQSELTRQREEIVEKVKGLKIPLLEKDKASFNYYERGNLIRINPEDGRIINAQRTQFNNSIDALIEELKKDG